MAKKSKANKPSSKPAKIQQKKPLGIVSSSSTKQKATKQSKNAVAAASKKSKSNNNTNINNNNNSAVDHKNESSSVKGKYIFFKNPKYDAIAKKLVQLSAEEIGPEVDKHNFSLQEKIHVGNLLSNLAAKEAMQGNFQIGGKKLFYNAQKTEKFEKLYEDLLNKTKVSLQKVCQLNQMPKSAPKETLAERVADGLLSGRIPKCPQCFGGRLRFNIYTGEYFCPGYIDGGHFFTDLGDDYIFCNHKFAFDDIQREEFIENDPKGK